MHVQAVWGIRSTVNAKQPFIQNPEPGRHLIRHRGDVLEFTLHVRDKQPGQALLRTNIGCATVHRAEIVRDVEDRQPRLSRDWHDIPMRTVAPDRFAVTLPLLEVGAFEAKACFLPANSPEPLWPEGDNTWIKVEPADVVCGNTMYTAFVRQFGAGKFRRGAPPEHENEVRFLEEADHTVSPPSGKFRDLIHELDFIIGSLHCRILQLLPIHPPPTTYARMGRFGSPFAALDFYDIDPALAEFDRRTTPLDQFEELVDAVHTRGAKLFLDLPINHTGWASWLQIHHPEWFARHHDRSFESPGAWGVEWEDLSRLDYRHRELWRYMADVFLFWCGHGVDGFRCDAGYMVPLPVWEYITAKVRQEYPDTIFLLEGLGGKAETVASLLTRANLDWAYSEIFQNHDQSQLEAYVPRALAVSSSQGLLVNFAETHDNSRLAARSSEYARLRTAVAALFSPEGAFGITNGVEWLADQKLDVHGATSLNWDNPINLVRHIARLNAILVSHPCFYAGAELRLVHEGHFNTLALLRTSRDKKSSLLVLANLNDTRPAMVSWPATVAPPDAGDFFDLMTGDTTAIETRGARLSCTLGPAQVACLSRNHDDIAAIEEATRQTASAQDRIHHQMLRAKAMEVFQHYADGADISAVDVDELAGRLQKDAWSFCIELATGDAAEIRPSSAVLTSWRWPQDARRTVPVPFRNLLAIRAGHPFTALLLDSDSVVRREPGLPQADGSYVALFLPPDNESLPQQLTLDLKVHGHGHGHRTRSRVLYTAPPSTATVGYTIRGNDPNIEACALGTNGRGAMIFTRAAWSAIASRYDALLAANLHPSYPVDRRVIWPRCRAWLVYRGYSQQIDPSCQTAFSVLEDDSLSWTFAVPCGMGKLVYLQVRLSLIPNRNTATLAFRRESNGKDGDRLDDNSAVHIIVRPDVEDRSFHEVTKAYMGPESAYPDALSADPSGFVFAPYKDHRLEMKVSTGSFTLEPEWLYMVPHPVEADRGMDSQSDLFSPGYFTFDLCAGDHVQLQGEVLAAGESATPAPKPLPNGKTMEDSDLGQAARKAFHHYVVKRDDSHTVIAGYPWFLDWGRDTLIGLRGMISAGMIDEARDILTQFGKLESGGTLPNMIRGDDHSNRDTSDAPLWFLVACRDLIHAEGNRNALEIDCGGRPLQQVLLSIANACMAGTENGIRMDPTSALIFSPAHFTWMDTNHPAGTPREGYPIEIQALWCAALDFLGEIAPGSGWEERADQVRSSIVRYFANEQKGCLSDCLHASQGTPAEEATADDAVRPNQLLAVTMGAVRERSLCLSILQACEELLVPGAIRSLADREVAYGLPIQDERGYLLNDPHRPYWGVYRGDEQGRRKPAYHNGTAWTWLFPSYCEALYNVGGETCRPSALSLLSSAAGLINSGCVGHLPEILDGDAPHTPRGCGAQAWGVTELYRVFSVLTQKR